MAASLDTDRLISCNIPVLLDLPMAPLLLFICVSNQTFCAFDDYNYWS